MFKVMRWSKIIFPWTGVKNRWARRGRHAWAGLSPSTPVRRRREGLRVSRSYWWNRLRTGSSAGVQRHCDSQGTTCLILAILHRPYLVATLCCLICQLPCELAAPIHVLSFPGIFFFPKSSAPRLKTHWSYCPVFKGSHIPSPGPCKRSGGLPKP